LLTQSDLVITYAVATAFLVNYSLASLVVQSQETTLRLRPFASVLIMALALSAILASLRMKFTFIALPVAAAVALPSLTVAVRVARSWKSLSVITRALVVSCVLFSMHNLDFAFLRDRPNMAPLGFTVATLIIFALSITSPAVVLERVTEQQARIDVEVETARRIQTRLLPSDISLAEIEFLTYMRPAESVGGDYFDIHTTDFGSWLFLGDVTGHGLGAGLVALMAQSTISSILESRPDICPAELNFLANRILAANLTRMDEQRHLSFVAIRISASYAFEVSGCHDSGLIFRAANASVERLALADFPMGLGFLGELPREAFREQKISLGPGDVLFIGSDGITEAAPDGNAAAGQFGEDAVIAILEKNGRVPLPELRSKLLRQLEEYTRGVYRDDVSFVIVRARQGPLNAHLPRRISGNATEQHAESA
jgi:serine phosphatase RsbU (regulator of sigma subunit)